MKQLVNLTPHPVILITGDGSHVTVQPSGQVARCTTKRESGGTIEFEAEGKRVSAPLTLTSYGEVEGLPDPEPGTMYIVSALVAQASPRTDLLMVDDLVRDENGYVIGCRGFARPAR